MWLENDKVCLDRPHQHGIFIMWESRDHLLVLSVNPVILITKRKARHLQYPPDRAALNESEIVDV